MESKKKSYIPDSRFALIAKEARIVSVFWLLYFAATMAACYFLGGGDPAEYSYICGLCSHLRDRGSGCYLYAKAPVFRCFSGR